MMHILPAAHPFTPDERRRVVLPFWTDRLEEIEVTGLFSVWECERPNVNPYIRPRIGAGALLEAIERRDAEGRTWWIMREHLPAFLGISAKELADAVRGAEEAVAELWEDAA